MSRTLLTLSSVVILALVGCAAEEELDQDYVVNTDTLQVNKKGDRLDATFTGASLRITATGQRTADGAFSVRIGVGDGFITMELDTAARAADVDGTLDMTEAESASLAAFAKVFYASMPDRGGIADKVFRLASLYAERPVNVPVEARRIESSSELRGVTSLCQYYYNGWNYRAVYDYECSCSWGFCRQCGGSQTAVIGGPNVMRGFDSGCFGACGAGCSSGTDYSVDCANHDACVNGGYSSWQCWDEWRAAADDFVFESLGGAPHC